MGSTNNIAAGMSFDGTTIIQAQGVVSAIVPPQKSYVYPTSGNATSGFSTTIPNGITIFIINVASLLGAGTVILPAIPSDGMPITIECPKGITLFTLQANSGQTISNNYLPSAIGVNTPLRLKYSGINSTWYPN